MQGWRAWYDDDGVYSSAHVAWADLPETGMVGVVVYEEPPYRRIVDGGDWYWMEDGMIHCTETHGDWGLFVEPPKVACQACVKKSGDMSDDAFRAVQREMMEARAWP